MSYDPSQPIQPGNIPTVGSPAYNAAVASGVLPFKKGTPEYEEAGRRAAARADETVREFRRWRRWSGIKAALGMVNNTVWHLGMYSADPTIARMGMVHTAREEIGIQREIHAQERVQDVALRAAQEAAEEERMRKMARIMAEEIVAAARRERA